MFSYFVKCGVSGEYMNSALSFAAYWFACSALSLKFDIDELDNEIRHQNAIYIKRAVDLLGEPNGLGMQYEVNPNYPKEYNDMILKVNRHIMEIKQ